MGANHAPNTNPKIAKSQANCRILIESKYISKIYTYARSATKEKKIGKKHLTREPSILHDTGPKKQDPLEQTEGYVMF